MHLLIAPLASTFNTQMDVRAVVITFAVQILWILAHWEEYHTGACWGVPLAALGLLQESGRGENPRLLAGWWGGGRAAAQRLPLSDVCDQAHR